MKNILFLACASLIGFASCSNMRSSGQDGATKDSTRVGQSNSASPDTSLTAILHIAPEVKLSDSIALTFTVHNRSTESRKFCKWHTPFEPLMSKYLDITDENGAEAAYKGPMAKRMMPPPASSYLSLAPADSLSVTVNLLKAYALAKLGTYTVKYNAQNVSGLVVQDSLTFTLKP